MSSETRQAWALGGTIFGATMMLVIGVYQVMMGIAVMANDALFVVGPEYTYLLSTTAWGWIHLIVGGLAVITGLFLYTGAMWARGVGIGLAAIAAVANFLFLPYYPLWSVVLIAMAVFVIWSLAAVSMPSGVDGRTESIMGDERGERSRGRDWSSMNEPDTSMNEPSMRRDAERSSYRGGAEAEQEAERRHPTQ